MSQDLVPTNEAEYTSNQRSFPPGPVFLRLVQPSGKVSIQVSDRASQPTVVVRAKIKSGPAADVVRNTRLTLDGRHLTVKVPTPSGHNRGVTIVSGGGTMNIVGGIGGRVIINGRDVTSEIGGQREPEIETIITLPKRSWVELDLESADAVIRGEVENLRVDGTSCSVAADVVGELTAELSSGQIRVDRVTKNLDVEMSSGSFQLAVYEGSRAKVRLSSGSARIQATHRSSGTFDIRVSSGSATLTGSSHLNVIRKVSSGSLRVS